jgi:hypothetical protein
MRLETLWLVETYQSYEPSTTIAVFSTEVQAASYVRALNAWRDQQPPQWIDTNDEGALEDCERRHKNYVARFMKAMHIDDGDTAAEVLGCESTYIRGVQALGEPKRGWRMP